MAPRILHLLAACLLAICIIVIARTIQFSFHKAADKPCKSSDEDYITADDAILARFSQALRFKTVSKERGVYDEQELLKFQLFLLKEYAYIFNHPLVKYEIIGKYSFLIHVQGRDPSLKPYMVAGHLDVVPASNDSWEVPPFEGRIKDGYIYGRGTLDAKNGVMGSIEALQFLLQRDFKPNRGIYFAYGHDEEVHGIDGAKEIAKVLRSRKVQLEFIIDEGTVIVEGVFPGVDIPYALIGVAEKGYLVVELSVTTAGGHSSMPPKQTTIGILANAISRLESCPVPAILDYNGPVYALFEQVAPKVNLPVRIILANLWLFKYLFISIVSRQPSTNALLRTTTAVTRFNAGVKDNVIAPTATARVNHRIHPGNTVDEILEHDRKCINDNRVKLSVATLELPSPVSRWDKDVFGYQVVSESIRQVFPEVGVAPSLMVAGTDTKHYLDLTPSIYRFYPSVLNGADLKRIHGFNERISVKNYEQTINYFYHLMINADKKPQQDPPKEEL